ncbi:MAG: hypothetical protein V4538_15095 [Bacteroidota bacterium]
MADYFKNVDTYNGFDIVHYIRQGGETDYFYIAKDGERFSGMYMASPKACKNVIETHLRAKKDHVKIEEARKALNNYLQTINPIYLSFPIKKSA